MDMPQFDGSGDAYRWLICGNTKEWEVLEAVKVLRNSAYGGHGGVDAIYMLVGEVFTTLAF
jgi:hypothetical protein